MAEDEKLPEGVALTPFDDHFCEDPHAVLAELRARAPVHHDRELGRWYLTRHREVTEVLRDKSLWVDPRKANPDSYHARFFAPNEHETGEDLSMLFLDDPDHRRLRSLVSRAFTSRAVEAMRPRARAIAHELLDAVSGDAEFDLVARFAGPLPATVIAEMLGVDPARRDEFKAWSDTSNAAFFNPFAGEAQKAAGAAAQANLDALFRDEIAKRRATPHDDLIAGLLRAEEEGDRLSEHEIVTMCNLLLIAGNVTTTDLIGNAVRNLFAHPEQLAALRARPELVPNAVEEVLRYDPPVQNTGRIAPRELEIGGCPIAKGESITVSLASANRDPAVCPEPDRFDVAREKPQHQSFGGGLHSCLGAPLARVEAQEALAVLLERCPELAPSTRGSVWRRVPGFRGVESLWVRKKP